MLKSIITSETRIKLLLKFFLNPGNSGYLRQLAKEFGESTNSIRLELNKLSQARILTEKYEGRNRIFKANESHPLFEEIRSIVLKSTGIDKVISDILNKLGNLEFAFIRGDYAVGMDSGLIELVVVGSHINMSELDRVKTKTEKLIDRKISVLILDPDEFNNLKNNLLSKSYLVLMENKKK